MTRKVKGLVARASLDNILLPKGCEEIKFSSFFIKKSPNCMRHVTMTKEDGTKDILPHSPDEDDIEPAFPKCEYYLEIELGEVDPFAFDEGQKRLAWALDRLRLFKPGMLWGTLYGLFDPKDHPVGIYEFKRIQEEGPYPLNYQGGYKGYFVIKEDEVESIIDFVNELQNTSTNSFAVALRRFHLYFDRDLIQDRFLDLMVALESLFSDDNEAIAYKIALRAAYLIESEAKKRKDTFDFLRNAYKARSSIVHGKHDNLWLEEKTLVNTQTNLDRLEEVVRKSLLILLRRVQKGIILKSSELDDNLFFNQ